MAVSGSVGLAAGDALVGLAAGDALPELANVHWRARVSDASLTRIGRRWTLTTIGHTVPFLVAAGLVVAVKPLLFPVALILLAHAWAIPELNAARGAKVLRHPRGSGDPDAERAAAGLLGDLLDHAPRALQADTGLVLEPAKLGVWILGAAGAVLVRPGGRRVHCYCVKATDPELPVGDRIAHLLLALRADETGFATVANVAFSGARWRLRRRLPAAARGPLDLAGTAASRAPLGRPEQRKVCTRGQWQRSTNGGSC